LVILSCFVVIGEHCDNKTEKIWRKKKFNGENGKNMDFRTDKSAKLPNIGITL
jgi:hypothetical protein